eukprot:gene26281-32215_t
MCSTQPKSRLIDLDLVDLELDMDGLHYTVEGYTTLGNTVAAALEESSSNATTASRKKLHLFRGLPGSGKTTAAGALPKSVVPVSADDYFMIQGKYVFDSSKLSEAHQQCQAAAVQALKAGRSVTVHNTFTQAWEMAPFVKLAAKYDADLVVQDFFGLPSLGYLEESVGTCTISGHALMG